jgi:sigma-E factor negative regulatory protein RseA
MAGNEMDTQKQLHNYISAMADGELAASEFDLAFATLDTPAGRAAWDLYHEIGHALRSQYGGFEAAPGFAARLAARLAVEAPLRRVPAASSSGKRGTGAASEAPVSTTVTSLP